MILALYGAGAMGREFKYMADAGNEWAGVVFIDDHAISEELMGCPVLGFQKFCGQYRPEEARFVIAIGEPRVRKEAYEKMKRAGYEGAILRDPTAYISPDAEVGEATAVCRGAFIGSLARVGRNVYLSAGTAVGHDSVIGDHTRLGVHAFVGGHTMVGENVFVGSGAMLRDRIQIGDRSIIGLGAAVFQNVPDQVTMIGNPARISGESGDRPVYGGSAAAAERTEEKPESAAAEDAKTWTPARIAETYWEVFSGCFEGYDFNPVTFRFHEDGWDSASQMALVAGLEAAFGISFKGREVLKMNSFESGLKLVRKKLDEKNREEG